MRAVIPPCLLPSMALRPPATTAYGFDPAEAPERARCHAARPDQRRDFLERLMTRELRDIVSAVVKPIVFDERDRGLQDRSAPMQRLSGRVLRFLPFHFID